MIKEYKTIQEVVGPLMLVKSVENVTYDELGEILLPSGEKRLCKVLELNGSDALVQLFESSAGINLKESTAMNWLCRRKCLAACLTVWDVLRMAVRLLFQKREWTSMVCR